MTCKQTNAETERVTIQKKIRRGVEPKEEIHNHTQKSEQKIIGR